MLMGAGVVSTIRKGIADLDAFKTDPGVFAYGMLWCVSHCGLLDLHVHVGVLAACSSCTQRFQRDR